MKNSLFVLAIVFLTAACTNTTEDSKDRNISLNDTITTSSGLKYIFLKEGKGRKIESGSKVKSFTNLYINDDDSVFWTTATSKDSVFQFIHDISPLITGFSELNKYLSEGDEVIAILPYSIAYGKEGRRGIPPAATLVYNPYVVKSVSEPRETLVDTLYSLAKGENIQASMNHYDKVVGSELKNDFHTEIDDMFSLLSMLNKDSLHQETQQMADFFINKTEDNDLLETLKYYKLESLEAQSKFQEAIDLVSPLANGDGDQEFWVEKLKELKEKLSGK